MITKKKVLANEKKTMVLNRNKKKREKKTFQINEEKFTISIHPSSRIGHTHTQCKNCDVSREKESEREKQMVTRIETEFIEYEIKIKIKNSISFQF